MTGNVDDFSIFEGTEHMFFGLAEPFAMIREELEEVFVSQIESSRVHAIIAKGEPKFLTIGYRSEPDEGKVVVTHYGVCFQANIDVENDDDRVPELPLTMTVCVGRLDQPGEESMQTWVHLLEDADGAFEQETFEQRFMEFKDAVDASD